MTEKYCATSGAVSLMEAVNPGKLSWYVKNTDTGELVSTQRYATIKEARAVADRLNKKVIR